jgi:hypothetical protein
MADSSSVSVLVNIFTAPSAAFAALKERPNPWLALAIVIALAVAVSFLYLRSVDLPWMLDHVFSQNRNITDAQRDQLVDGALRFPALIYASSVISPPIQILALLAVVGLYFTAVSFATNDGVKFGHWFAMSAWALLPTAFGLAAAFVNLLVTDARFLPPEQLNPLSFANLLGIDLEGASQGQVALLSRDITLLWSILLFIVGYQVMSQRTLVRAATVVLAPIVVIVGIITALVAL